MNLKNKDSFICTVWLFFLVFPVSFELISVGSKPIDLVFSDIYPVIFFTLLFVFNIKVRSRSVWYIPFFAMFYYLSISIVGSLIEQGALSNIFSSIRFSKQLLLIPCGAAFFALYGWKGLKGYPYVVIAIFVIIILSDFFSGSFPRGCGYEGRWGGCIGGTEVYGFPNSSSSYFALLTLSLLVYLDKQISIRYLALLGLGVGVILSVLSLSRASWLFLFCGFFLFFLYQVKLIYKLLFGAVISIIIVIFHESLLSLINGLTIFDGVTGKVSYYADGAEISSGRVGIWQESLALIAKSPIFGYGFEYFSNYVDGYDTPHQQYLELLFKSGLIGLSIYLIVIFLFWQSVKSITINSRSSKIYFITIFCCLLPLLINGLFQPILSYSLVGNLFMFALGISLEANKQLKLSSQGYQVS